jgi:hypothetical protein
MHYELSFHSFMKETLSSVEYLMGKCERLNGYPRALALRGFTDGDCSSTNSVLEQMVPDLLPSFHHIWLIFFLFLQTKPNQTKQTLAASVFVPSVFGENMLTAEFGMISAETALWAIGRKEPNF